MRVAPAGISALAGAALTAILAACGGSSHGGDSAQVAAVIKQAAANTDPAKCTQLETQRFLEQTELAKGKAAVKSCRDDARDPTGNPRSTKVSDVSVDGDVAHARAAFEGGELDGQAVNVRLVRQHGRWKLDHLDSFAAFDRKRFLRAAETGLLRGPQALPRGTAECIVGRFAALPDAALQRVYLSGDAGRVAALSGPCFISLLRRELARQGVPKPLADCVVAKADKPPYNLIRRIFLGEDAGRLFAAAARACLVRAADRRADSVGYKPAQSGRRWRSNHVTSPLRRRHAVTWAVHSASTTATPTSGAASPTPRI